MKKMAHKARRSRSQGILFLITMNDFTEREEQWRSVTSFSKSQNVVRIIP